MQWIVLLHFDYVLLFQVNTVLNWFHEYLSEIIKEYSEEIFFFLYFYSAGRWL